MICDELFSNELGKTIYSEALRAIEDFSMTEKLSNGVLVGLSGGPDSVLLLAFLAEFKKRSGADFKLLAVHVNHGIRGEEADRDESFSKEFAEQLGIEFLSHKIDVPTEAKRLGIGIEEAARNLRYSFFNQILDKRSDVNSIAVAHNASDNFETVLFNMMRGTGTKGLSGIAPVRDNILRPLIYLPKNDIVNLLDTVGLSYVIDSTNLSCEYSRNYIRSELIPRFKRLNSNPELSVNRLSENLRWDNDFIESYAKDFYEKYSFDGKFKIEDVKKLHFAPFSRFIMLMANKSGVFGIESVHIKKIYSLLDSGNFKISLPGDAVCISESGFIYISENSLQIEFSHSLSMGENVIDGFSDLILVSEEKIYDSYSNVYKIEIQAKLSFDIIKNGFFVRNKKDGDSYKFGGMTRKLKKLFNDKTVPPSKRNLVPVFCDGAGIAWVPGFRVRDEKTDRYAYVAILRKRDSKAEEKTFYIIK